MFIRSRGSISSFNKKISLPTEGLNFQCEMCSPGKEAVDINLAALQSLLFRVSCCILLAEMLILLCLLHNFYFPVAQGIWQPPNCLTAPSERESLALSSLWSCLTLARVHLDIRQHLCRATKRDINISPIFQWQGEHYLIYIFPYLQFQVHSFLHCIPVIF